MLCTRTIKTAASGTQGYGRMKYVRFQYANQTLDEYVSQAHVRIRGFKPTHVLNVSGMSTCQKQEPSRKMQLILHGKFSSILSIGIYPIVSP